MIKFRYVKNSNKTLTTTVVALIALVSVGVFVSSALGYDLVRMLPFVSTPDTSIPENVTKPDCEQDSTTTPCSELEALPEQSVVKDKRQFEQKPVSYGPLTETYTDEQYGFSFRYPEEMEVNNTGDTILRDIENPRAYAIKICTRSKPCAGTSASVLDFDDFEGTLSFGSGLRHVPISNERYTTGAGIEVLKQTYESKQFDSNGNDVTKSLCEMCGQSSRLVLFVNNQPIVFWQINGDVTFTQRIVDSIELVEL